ncbi:SusC/RagA family TonB-linked outer membrane protein [Leeuwenhoekiella sp. NPDC079379]|uniref:SusC/RagA family TonB-linked outer membrane protein n=1 Tax=Leeuwenhoekiella sp. NPDC079379 TaxID=3364122 RepID=UPI0037C7BF4A
MKQDKKPFIPKLARCFGLQKRKIGFMLFSFSLVLLFVSTSGYAKVTLTDSVIWQQNSISGTITDDAGVPVPGANIIEKGTSNGAQTDFDGNYTLKLTTNNPVLVISFVGYETQEINVTGDKNVYNLQLTVSTAALDEIVVVGYGTQRKREVTGSISSISAEAITEQSVTGFDQALAGRVAGVQVSQSSGAPGGATSIRVRGVSTPGNSEPLYVIDGIPVFNGNTGRQGGTQPSGVLNTINPNDIASVEILKDAASGAIYGSRAANGVVIITTKKGKEGPMKIDLDYSVGMQSKEKTLDVLDGPTYQNFITEFTGSAPNYTNPANTNWQDEIFDSAPMHNFNLRASGGSEDSKYSLSAGYLNQDGIIKGTSFERLSVRINTSQNLGDHFRIGNNFLISRSISNQVEENQIFQGAIPLSLIYLPVVPARNPDGTLGQPADVGTSFIRRSPLYVTDEQYFEAEQFRFLGNIYAEYDIFEDLTYRINLGVDFLYGGSDAFSPSYIGRGSANIIATGSRFDSREFIWLTEHTLNYNKTFNDIHTLDVLAGFTQQKSTYSVQNSSVQGYLSNDIIALNGGSEVAGVNGQLSDWSLMSFLGRVNYNLKDKYFLSGSIRRDGSSRFGPGNKWGVFPSFSAGWLVSDEEFFKAEFVSELKIRGSWGQLGNQEIAPFQYLPLLVNNAGYGFGGNLNSGVFNARPANPDVTWETATITDIGIDASFFNRQVTLSVDYYDKTTDDILLPGSLPLAYGFILNGVSQFPIVNAGSVRNQGFEFDLGIRGVSNDFSWSVNANLATVKNNVESLGQGGAIIVDSEALSTRFDVGMPVGAFYGYVVDGVFQNQAEIDNINPNAAGGVYYQSSGTVPGDFKFKDLDGNGVIDDKDQQVLGSAIPEFTYGLNASANYKNLDFSMAWQGVQGNEIFSTVLQQAGDFTKPDNKFTSLYNNAWRGEGTSNTVPRIGSSNANGNYRNSDYFVQDGSFLRLRSLQIGYTFSDKILEDLSLSKFRVYIGGQNLITFDKYDYGLDPEVGAAFENNLQNGVDYGRYPIPRIVSLGVNVGF